MIAALTPYLRSARASTLRFTFQKAVPRAMRVSLMNCAR